MISIMIYLLVLMCLSAITSSLMHKRIEEGLPLSCVMIIAFIYPFGLMGQMQIGTCILIVIVLIAAAITGFKHKLVIRNIFTNGIFWFLLSLLFLALSIRGKLFDQWDEFSHWGDVVKATVDLNGYATNPASMSAFQSYPPGMQIFQYALQKINISLGGTFSEWKCYFSYNLFLLCFMAPRFTRLSIKKPLFSISVLISILLLPTIFFNSTWYSLLIDVAVSVVFAYGLYSIVDQEQNEHFRLLNICSTCFILPLLKDVGMLFSVSLAVVYCITYYKKGHKWNIFAPTLSCILPIITWKINVRITGANEVFPFKYDFVELGRVLSGEGETYRQTVLKNFPKALITTKFSIGSTGIGIPFLVLIVGVCVVAIISLRKREKIKSSSVMNTNWRKALAIALPVVIVIYTIGLWLSYMFQFSEYESINFASMSRYLSIPLCGISILSLYCWVDILKEKEHEFIGVLLCCIMLAAPLENTYNLLRGGVVENSIHARTKYITLSDKVRRSISQPATIYLISQEDNGGNFWWFHYLLRPNKMNIGQLLGWTGFEAGGYSIGKPYYEGDIWSSDIGAQELMDQWVSNYDYIVVFKSNDYLKENYAELFDHMIVDNSLWRIEKSERIAKLVE